MDSPALVSELRSLRQQIERLVADSEGRIGQLQRDLAAMTQAAIEREREYAKRENELNGKLLAAVTQTHASKFDAAQLSDKLGAAESLNRALTAQAVQIEGTLRAQVAQIGGLEGVKRELAAQREQKEAELAAHQLAAEARLADMTAERDLLRSRLAELADARSRRLLMKFGLVNRCAWEKS